MRILGITAKGLFMICLPVLLLTASVAVAANSLWLYEYGFEKYDISQTTGLTEVELEDVATGLISYFNSDEEYVSLELFNPEEVIHFRDVKGLIRLDYWVALGTLLYALAYAGVSLFWRKRKYWRQLAWGVVGGSGITLALMLMLGLGTLLGFDQLWLQFHLLFFSNEFWSTEGYMLQLFAGGRFFFDAILFCALATVGSAVIFGGLAGGYLYFKRNSIHRLC